MNPVSEPKSSYSENAKKAIVQEVIRLPGRSGREIAASLGLEKSRVNSFLYGEGKSRFGLIETEYRWHPPKAITVEANDPPLVSNRTSSQKPRNLSSTRTQAKSEWSQDFTSSQPISQDLRNSAQSQPPHPPSPPLPQSVCGALANLPLTQATLKIRTLNLEIVELAFADDDFHLLDDRLIAELSIRRSELVSQSHRLPEKKTSDNRTLLILVIALTAFVFGIFASEYIPKPVKQIAPPTVKQ